MDRFYSIKLGYCKKLLDDQSWAQNVTEREEREQKKELRNKSMTKRITIRIKRIPLMSSDIDAFDQFGEPS